MNTNEIGHNHLNINLDQPHVKETSISKKLEEFCTDHCSNTGFTSGEIKQMVEAGKNISIALNKVLTEKTEPPPPSPKAAVQLMWFLMSQAVEKGHAFTSGAIRLDPNPSSPNDSSKGKVVENFLYECGKKEGLSYTRISTHMKENLTKDNLQKGIDLRDMGLPKNKHTILFAAQPDGTIYIKMEPFGCPPFWKKGFQTLKNFKEFALHAMEFLTTRFEKLPGHKEKTTMLASRKEHVPDNIKKEFKTALNVLFPTGEKTFFQKLTFQKTDSEKIREELYAEGAKKGVSKMKTIITDTSNLTFDQIVTKNLMIASLEIHHKTIIKDTGFTGDVKGNEVVIAFDDKTLEVEKK